MYPYYLFRRYDVGIGYFIKEVNWNMDIEEELVIDDYEIIEDAFGTEMA